jgi:Fe-S-cluster containining protein
MLTKDDLCSIYEDRPIICREYDPATCDHTGGDYEYDEEFTEPEQLEAYAKKVLGERAYERAKTRARAKAEGKTRKKKKRTRRRRKASSRSGGGKAGSRRKARGAKKKRTTRGGAARRS